MFLCFRKATQEIFSELDETKAKPSIFIEASRRLKMRGRGARSQPHPRVARPTPGPRHQGVRPVGPPPGTALSPINSPWWEKPGGQIAFPQNILQAAAIIIARSGGSWSSSRHLAGEGNSCRRPSPPPWSPLEWCVSSLLIHLKRIYNFWCSMLVFTPFAYCFVTLRGTFMHFLKLTY
jgi:hypothetical protein